MALLVVAEPREAFEAWRDGADRGRPPSPPTTQSKRGRDGVPLRALRRCATRSAARPPAARVGPDLTHVASRQTIAAGTLPNTRGYARGLDRRPADDQARATTCRMIQLAAARAQRAARLPRGSAMSDARGLPRSQDRASTATTGPTGDALARGSSRPGARPRASGAGSPRSTTRSSAAATSSPAFVFLAPRRPAGAGSCGCSSPGPRTTLIGPDRYNQIFTMHGTTMMFLFAVPVMEAVAVYLVPLMVGTRNIAFPRLNAFGYWIYLVGGMLLWVAFVLDIGPRRRLVRLRAALRARILARQARRHLGADDHLHRGLGARRRGRDRSSPCSSSARPACRSTASRCSSGRCWSRRSWSSSRCRR